MDTPGWSQFLGITIQKMQDSNVEEDFPISEGEQDSFYVKSEERPPEEEQAEEPAEEPAPLRQKTSKSKKKHIKKQKDKTIKPPKKNHTSKEQQKQLKLALIGEKKANEIMHEMNKRYEKDLQLQQQRKLACRKLNFIEDLSQYLKNVYVCQKFIEHGGMSYFQRWLDKVQINDQIVEPGVSLRKGVLEILLDINVNTDNISKTNDIMRMVARQKRSQIKQLRQLSEKIVLKWNKIAYEAQ